MRKLILLGEGDFGPALLESTQRITGLRADDETFAIEGGSPDQIRKAVDSICNTVHREDSLVILCDFSMSSAVQEAWLVLEKRSMVSRMMMISGVNVPCVAAALTFKEQIVDNTRYAKSILEEGKAGINVLGSGAL